MRYDLAAMAKRNGTKRRAVSLRTIETTAAQEAELATIVMQVVRAWHLFARDRILPAYAASVAHYRANDQTRDDANQLDTEIDTGERGIARVILSLGPSLRSWVMRIERWFRNKWTANVKAAADVDVDTIIGPDDVAETIEATILRNVALIRGVSDDIRKRITEIVWRNYTAKRPLREVAKEITEATALARKRALLIASDQTVKLAAALDRERMQQAGIDEWIWRHSRKKHFRPEHKARDGKHYLWSKNDLEGDYPGVAIHCGCKSQAWMEL